MEHFNVWKLLAGLGIFMFGMQLLETSVKSLSGKAFRRIIRQYTNGRLKSIGSGTFVTALLQSSSAVSLMVLAFVGAGVMSMENAIGVIMGSNIGTTLTAWIVATLGFKIKIETFALPFVGVGAIGLILFKPSTKFYHFTCLLIGFGFLFLGLDYMKGTVEGFARHFTMDQIPNYGLWFYLLVGTILTGLMHSSAATIAITLAALNSQLINFDIGAVMVIGANIGTTITILFGSIGGAPPKKRVAVSHLIFNAVTGLLCFTGLPFMIWLTTQFVDIKTSQLTGLAMFHTLFNFIGVLLFIPFIGLLSRLLVKLFPEHKEILTLYIDKTPPEETSASVSALKNEILHLLKKCQLYNLRLLKIDEKLVFDTDAIEQNKRRNLRLEDQYENIKLLHAAIYTFYAKIQNYQLAEEETADMERMMFASRNIMNATKNFKSIYANMEELDGSENPYLNAQYALFRKRLVELCINMNTVLQLENQKEQYRNILKIFMQIDDTDSRFIKKTMNAVVEKTIHEMEIASLLLVNRLFNQSARMQIFSLKDLLLAEDQIILFDKALEVKAQHRKTL